MKPKYKFYFEYGTSYEKCHTLDYFLDKSLMEKRDIKVESAKMLVGDDAFYCTVAGEVGIIADGWCGNFCNDYQPRNGKSGRCRFSRNCYTEGGKFYLVKQDGKVVDG